MRVVPGLVEGPFADETEFKGAVVKRLSALGEASFFCIETEETIPGFPDVLKLPLDRYQTNATMIEFKCSDASGKIAFKKSQPLFYRQNYKKHWILILAWDKRTSQSICFTAEEILKYKSLSIRLPRHVDYAMKPEEI
jgi:hypothetical protein